MAFEGTAQGILKRQAGAGAAVHVLREEAEIVSTGALGVVHGRIRMLEELIHVVAIARVEGDADARRDGQLLTVNIKGADQAGDQLAGNHGGILCVVELGQEDDELVAPQSRQDIFLPQACAQASGCGRQQAVADRMAQGVVDLLEIVQVEEENARLQVVAAGDGERLIRAVDPQTPVGQAGKHVIVGEVVDVRFRGPVVGDVLDRSAQGSARVRAVAGLDGEVHDTRDLVLVAAAQPDIEAGAGEALRHIVEGLLEAGLVIGVECCKQVGATTLLAVGYPQHRE